MTTLLVELDELPPDPSELLPLVNSQSVAPPEATPAGVSAPGENDNLDNQQSLAAPSDEPAVEVELSSFAPAAIVSAPIPPSPTATAPVISLSTFLAEDKIAEQEAASADNVSRQQQGASAVTPPAPSAVPSAYPAAQPQQVDSEAAEPQQAAPTPASVSELPASSSSIPSAPEAVRRPDSPLAVSSQPLAAESGAEHVSTPASSSSSSVDSPSSSGASPVVTAVPPAPAASQPSPKRQQQDNLDANTTAPSPAVPSAPAAIPPAPAAALADNTPPVFQPVTESSDSSESAAATQVAADQNLSPSAASSTPTLSAHTPVAPPAVPSSSSTPLQATAEPAPATTGSGTSPIASAAGPAAASAPTASASTPVASASTSAPTSTVAVSTTSGDNMPAVICFRAAVDESGTLDPTLARPPPTMMSGSPHIPRPPPAVDPSADSTGPKAGPTYLVKIIYSLPHPDFDQGDIQGSTSFRISSTTTLHGLRHLFLTKLRFVSSELATGIGQVSFTLDVAASSDALAGSAAGTGGASASSRVASPPTPRDADVQPRPPVSDAAAVPAKRTSPDGASKVKAPPPALPPKEDPLLIPVPNSNIDLGIVRFVRSKTPQWNWPEQQPPSPKA